MKEWLLFALLLIVGIGMLIAGIVYMRGEKEDREAVRIYQVVSVLGAALTLGAVAFQIIR